MSKVNVPIAFMSLVASVLLWANVYNFKNRRPEQKVVSAKISVINLDQRKYMIAEMPEDVSLALAGNSDQIRNATQQLPNAIIDLSTATPGSKSYPLTILPVSARELLVNSALTARIRIEALKTNRVDVTVIKNGALPAGNHVESTDSFPRSVYVTGSADNVQKVAAIQAIVAYSSAVLSPEGIEVEARAVDSSGKIVNNVLLTVSDDHPEYTDDAVNIPVTVRVRVKLAPDTPKMPFR
jgi:YbbR domain-containing protein